MDSCGLTPRGECCPREREPTRVQDRRVWIFTVIRSQLRLGSKDVLPGLRAGPILAVSRNTGLKSDVRKVRIVKVCR